jgi:glycosyltransferase involved in cell wall biosynthesis
MTHYCIANAEAVKRAVVKMETVAPERIRVIYNGVEVGAPDSRAALTRASFGIPDRFPVVGIVANLKSIKRIDRFLRAAARLKRTDCHFIVLGAGPLEGTLKTLAQELGVLPRVHFYHTVEQTREIVSLFDVGLLTSESEGLSNVLIEYALAGIPAVAFNVGGNNEVVVDEQTGFLVNPFDEQMLVERVDDLLDHPEVAQRLGRAAQLRARDKFSVVSMVTQTERFYFEIAGSGLPKQFR